VGDTHLDPSLALDASQVASQIAFLAQDASLDASQVVAYRGALAGASLALGELD
jgi:hypothetical protein